MVVGKLKAEVCPLYLSDIPLGFVSEYKYLGVVLTSGTTLSFSAITVIRSFHRAVNSILYSRVKLEKAILMKLLYTNCVPILTYACAVREFNAADMRKVHVALNNAIRRIFSFAVWQSIRHLRIEYGYKSVYEIFAEAKSKFLVSAPASRNPIVYHLALLL